jgi:hypothetical protein
MLVFNQQIESSAGLHWEPMGTEYCCGTRFRSEQMGGFRSSLLLVFTALFTELCTYICRSAVGSQSRERQILQAIRMVVLRVLLHPNNCPQALYSIRGQAIPPLVPIARDLHKCCPILLPYHRRTEPQVHDAISAAGEPFFLLVIEPGESH